MKRSILRFIATVLLAMTVHPGFAAEPAHVPATPHDAANASLMARAERALRDYVAACSTGDDEAMERIVTSDAVIEYALAAPGTYFVVEAAALSANRSGKAGAAAHISDLWSFPTNDSNAVFVQYTTSSDVRSPAELSDSEYLALLEMRDRSNVQDSLLSADTPLFRARRIADDVRPSLLANISPTRRSRRRSSNSVYQTITMTAGYGDHSGGSVMFNLKE